MGGSGGLTLPGNLRTLPVLFLSLIKNVGLRKSALIPTDLRSAALCLLSTLPTSLLLRYIHPALYSLHDAPDDAGVPDPQTGNIVMPPLLTLSSQNLVPYGLYLLDDGVNQFLWVGRDAVPALLMDVFGVEDQQQIKQGMYLLPTTVITMNSSILIRISFADLYSLLQARQLYQSLTTTSASAYTPSSRRLGITPQREQVASSSLRSMSCVSLESRA